MLLTPNLGEIHLHKPRLNKNDTIVTRNQAIRAQIVVRLDWIPLHEFNARFDSFMSMFLVDPIIRLPV